MTEKQKHFNLKAQAKEKLLALGCAEATIHAEVVVDIDKPFPHFYKIDVAAINGKKIAVECGGCRESKLYELRNFPVKLRRTGEEIKFDQVIHIPYPIRFPHDKPPGEDRPKKERYAYLFEVYNKQIYEEFKDDPDFDIVEYNQQNQNKFKIHTGVWLNVPYSTTSVAEETTAQVHLGIIHIGGNKFRIIIGFNGSKGCKEFLNISETHKAKIIEELNKLPENFFTQDGYIEKNEKHPAPPYERVWNENSLMRCCDFSYEDLQQIEENQEFYMETSKYRITQYPLFDVVRVTVTEDEITEVIRILKSLYMLLMNPHKKTDEIIAIIKSIKMPRWQSYIMSKRYDALEKKIKEISSDTKVSIAIIKEVCKRLKNDAEYIAFVENDD